MQPISFEEIAGVEALNRFTCLAQRLFGASVTLVKPGSPETSACPPAGARNQFCRLLLSDPRGRQMCTVCGFRHQLEAVALRRPIQYRCHAGLIESIIPIVCGDAVVAVLQCGQIADRKLSRKDWEGIEPGLRGFPIDRVRLRRAYYRTRVIDDDLRNGLVELLEVFSGYVADTAGRLHVAAKEGRSRIVFLAESFIKSHLGEHISLGDVARESRTSTRNLTRVFALETGMTVLQYIHKLKIEQACTLLADRSVRISAAAFECGFGSIQQFNRVFRRHRGTTPREERKANGAAPIRTA